MIDLTPLDVRNKRGDFKRLMRGYDPQEVDVFLEIVADRLEVLVRENLQLKERTQSLQDQVATQAEREQAVQDALVTAQELRADIRAQSQREAEHVLKEAQAEGRNLITRAEDEAKRIVKDAQAESLERVRELERRIDHAGSTIQELERRRVRFLKEFRSLLARELDVVEVEQEKLPFEERAIDLDLGVRRTASRVQPDQPREEVEATPVPSPEEDEGPSYELGGSEQESEGATERETEPGAAAPPTVPPGPIGPPAVGPVERSERQQPDGAAESTPMPVPHPVLRVPREEGPMGGDAVGSGEGEGGLDGGPTIDVEDLRPADDPSGLQEADSSAPRPGAGFPDVPDLETLLAEAGGGEGSAAAGGGKSPPAARERREDSFILFDFDEKRRGD